MREIIHSLKTMIPANLLMGITAWLITRGDIWVTNGHMFVKISLLIGSIVLSTVVYITSLHLVKSKELLFLWGMIRGKVMNDEQ